MMRSPISKKDVARAAANWDWDLGNSVLYDLCRKYPEHKNRPEVMAKIWLIGRSYSASIERRKNVDKQAGPFFRVQVAPKIKKSRIDSWITSLAKISTIDETNAHKIIRVHAKVMRLFEQISGQEKRSLASKYLHFHKPNLFFIYDSQAKNGLSSLSSILPRSTRSEEIGDKEYRIFVEKCLVVRNYVSKRYPGFNLNPRQLDKLLLALSGRKNKAEGEFSG
jgi:hypothetical protein